MKQNNGFDTKRAAWTAIARPGFYAFLRQKQRGDPTYIERNEYYCTTLAERSALLLALSLSPSPSLSLSTCHLERHWLACVINL